MPWCMYFYHLPIPSVMHIPTSNILKIIWLLGFLDKRQSHFDHKSMNSQPPSPTPQARKGFIAAVTARANSLLGLSDKAGTLEVAPPNAGRRDGDCWPSMARQRSAASATS